MERVTKKHLETRLNWIERQTGLKLELEYQTGVGVRLCRSCESGGSADLSRRVSWSEMCEELDTIYNLLQAVKYHTENGGIK